MDSVEGLSVAEEAEADPEGRFVLEAERLALSLTASEEREGRADSVMLGLADAEMEDGAASEGRVDSMIEVDSGTADELGVADSVEEVTTVSLAEAEGSSVNADSDALAELDSAGSSDAEDTSAEAEALALAEATTEVGWKTTCPVGSIQMVSVKVCRTVTTVVAVIGRPRSSISYLFLAC